MTEQNNVIPGYSCQELQCRGCSRKRPQLVALCQLNTQCCQLQLNMCKVALLHSCLLSSQMILPNPSCSTVAAVANCSSCSSSHLNLKHIIISFVVVLLCFLCCVCNNVFLEFVISMYDGLSLNSLPKDLYVVFKFFQYT